VFVPTANVFGILPHAWQEEAISYIIALAKDDSCAPLLLVQRYLHSAPCHGSNNQKVFISTSSVFGMVPHALQEEGISHVIADYFSVSQKLKMG
jgi:tRNA A37 threonylcarbamoyladenosine synthetase subunit TsaC/SUA5/YrdC